MYREDAVSLAKTTAGVSHMLYRCSLSQTCFSAFWYTVVHSIGRLPSEST